MTFTRDEWGGRCQEMTAWAGKESGSCLLFSMEEVTAVGWGKGRWQKNKMCWPCLEIGDERIENGESQPFPSTTLLALWILLLPILKSRCLVPPSCLSGSSPSSRLPKTWSWIELCKGDSPHWICGSAAARVCRMVRRHWRTESWSLYLIPLPSIMSPLKS